MKAKVLAETSGFLTFTLNIFEHKKIFNRSNAICNTLFIKIRQGRKP